MAEYSDKHIETIAVLAHSANLIYCMSIGDMSHLHNGKKTVQ
jgi:hypothetical protein